MSSRKSLFFVLPFLLFWIANANAATINAASCSQSDVQAAVNAAVTGDIIKVMSGTCTWTDTYVSIPNNKKITIQGSGIEATKITKAPYGAAVFLNQSGSRVTQIHFIDGYINVDGDGWRIDHCKFFRANEGGLGVYVRGNREDRHPTGLVDHCIFHNTGVLVHGWAGEKADALWSQPLNLGSGLNVVYVEDNEFTATLHKNAMDAHIGGRYVFRFNIINDTNIEAHSVQGAHRAARSWEIYNNTFNQKNRSVWVPMMLRGGTGVVFNNTITGNWGLPRISLDNVRSCPDTRDFGTELGWCTGTSRWDGNIENGYPCRDQIGRSTDQWHWTTSSPYPPQQLVPAYSWNNKLGTSDVTFVRTSCAQSVAHIQPNRDYFDNTVKPGYAPYAYPHPLLNTWGTTTITANEPTPPMTATAIADTGPTTSTTTENTSTTTTSTTKLTKRTPPGLLKLRR